MNPKGGLSILDALDNLNTLVDADTLDEIEVTDEAKLIPHKGEKEEGRREIYWVCAGPDDQTLHAIKMTLQSVFEYLQLFYNNMKRKGNTKQLVEGVNTIMVLVGEAAQKVDRFGAIFNQKVTDFPEYKELQSFYQKKVIRESFADFAKTPIAKEEVLPEQMEWEKELQELLQEEEGVEEVAGVHILNDIEVIKKDHLYELFYLKNEAGYDFYSYDLARTIKLACDFGEFSQEYFGDDPLLQIKNWEDRELHLQACKMLKAVRLPLEKFYTEAMQYKRMEVVSLVHKACMALMLAANPRNLIRQFSLKGSHLFFSDFLLFLREVLHNREFEKLVIYGPPPGKPFFQHTLDLVHAFCYHLFILPHDQEELKAGVESLIERTEHKKGKTLSEILLHSHHALDEALKKHPNGPIFKALDIIRDKEKGPFDPLMQGNIPFLESVLRNKNRELKLLHLPCPIEQEWINHAAIIEEFKTFLRACSPEERLLLINFQDRTSWKEHARSQAIEEIGRQAEFATNLMVVTLASDTDFFNQTGVYQDLDDAKGFIDQFAEHLGDESTGYYFSHELKSALFPDFIESLLSQIHATFFDKKKKLSYLERLDFIQLGYHFITLKLIEIIQPTYLALSSKDALDIGGSASVGFLSFLALAKGKKLDSKKIQTLLFGPTLMHRERLIHKERFDRLCALVHLLEEKGDYLLPFASLYRKESLQWDIV